MKINRVVLSPENKYVFYPSDKAYIYFDSEWKPSKNQCFVVRYGLTNELIFKSYGYISFRNKTKTNENKEN
jgi:hypothetical protein